MDLPYKAEYAKSSRACCRSCKNPIEKGILRLATVVQSPKFDAKITHWFHSDCFFLKQRPKTEDDIENFESLRMEDQKLIKGRLTTSAVIVPDSKGKGKKRDAAASAAKNAALKDFKIEYSKSGRATCRGCELKILKDEIRISKKDFETDIGKKYGGQDMWHHLTCFAKLRAEIGYFESADKLPGFKTLNKEDQNEAKKQLAAIKQEDAGASVAKKAKLESETPGLTEEEAKTYAEQNKLYYKNRDQLAKLKKDELIKLLEENKQAVPTGIDEILNRVADIMTFGALLPCKVCKHGGHFVFEKFGYKCHANLTEWTNCHTVVRHPERKAFKIPKDLAKEHSVLKKYKYVERVRVVKPAPASVKPEKEEADAGPRVVREAPVLYNMEFVILSKPERGKEQLKKEITKLGGKVTTKIHDKVMAVIATKDDVTTCGSRMETVKEHKIHVVPEDFVDEASKHRGKIPELIEAKSLCDWGADPKQRLPVEPLKSKSRSMYVSSGPSKIKLQMKGGTVVDPDSELDNVAHVYTDKKLKWTSVLTKIDVQKQKNSYYKLQLLEADNKNKYWVFRSWGRIGTTIGDTKVQKCHSLHDAKEQFCALFLEKTGNVWGEGNFEKVAGLFYPIDVDYDDDNAPSLDIVESDSKLAGPVQALMKQIFDVKAMQKVMAEFELDTEKMPLGKLSRKQLENAYAVLTELLNLLSTEAPEARFIDATNRFFSFVPHSFGVDAPPILRDEAIIKEKVLMLDSLMELEIAYNLMRSTGSEHTVDSYYKKLNTDIEVLAKDSEEYAMIEKYLKNTHAATHDTYELKLLDVFSIKRNGEDKRFKPFKKLHNHQLLWHGSRTTNYPGILSQGLRIAPPEAPVTGYMFGKGIYFADMVSKSANYCCTTGNGSGLLLLCDVALGNMYERTAAEYVEKLPKGKHSTKGVGMTEPKHESTVKFNGIDVPLGQGVKNTVKSSLLYNEYIVYDVAQVNVKYLVKVDFCYKY